MAVLLTYVDIFSRIILRSLPSFMIRAPLIFFVKVRGQFLKKEENFCSKSDQQKNPF